MTPDRDAGPVPTPPHVQLIQMATAYWVSRALYAAARLELADRIAGRIALTPPIWPAETGAHAPSLHRLLRALAGLGIVPRTRIASFRSRLSGRRFAAGRPVPRARRCWPSPATGGGADGSTCSTPSRPARREWSGRSVRPLFEYLAREPEEASYFNDAMIGFHGAEPAAVAAAYDFSGCETVVDVGGGTGNLLAAILERRSTPARCACRAAARPERGGRAHRVTRARRSHHPRADRLLHVDPGSRRVPICSRTSFTTGAKTSA